MSMGHCYTLLFVRWVPQLEKQCESFSKKVLKASYKPMDAILDKNIMHKEGKLISSITTCSSKDKLLLIHNKSGPM